MQRQHFPENPTQKSYNHYIETYVNPEAVVGFERVIAILEGWFLKELLSSFLNNTGCFDEEC
jgi:hypothetical protein